MFVVKVTTDPSASIKGENLLTSRQMFEETSAL